ARWLCIYSSICSSGGAPPCYCLIRARAKAYLLRGSTASRSPSPNRLKAMTVMKMASPGMIMYIGSTKKKPWLTALDSIWPQLGDPQRVAAQPERRAGDDADQGDGEHQQREGQEDVHRAGDHRVDPPAEEAGDHPHDHADDHREQRGQEPDQQRVPRADHHPG